MPGQIHPRTRNAFRDACSDFAVIRKIEGAFLDEGLLADDQERDWDQVGQRRGTFDRHTSMVDWDDSQSIRRVLNVFEEILSWVTDDTYRSRLTALLARDGFPVDAGGRIEYEPLVAVNIPLSSLSDSRKIREHLDRIAKTMDSDPGVAISGAKALIEATAKVVLAELGEAYDEKADIPELVKAAQKALLLNRDDVAPTQAGAEVIKKILSNLSTLAIGVAELRNLYGPDHGRTKPVVGLGPRHAHLAVGAAKTYCTMLLETLDARRAT